WWVGHRGQLHHEKLSAAASTRTGPELNYLPCLCAGGGPRSIGARSGRRAKSGLWTEHRDLRLERPPIPIYSRPSTAVCVGSCARQPDAGVERKCYRRPRGIKDNSALKTRRQSNT